MHGDWTKGRGRGVETLADGGWTWTIRPSETWGEGCALYRLPTGQRVPREGSPTAEEQYALGVFRSAAEARLAREMLARPLDEAQVEALLQAGGFEPTFETDEGRRGWGRRFDGGYLSLFHGSDENPRDAVGQMNLVTRPGEIHSLFVFSHGRDIAQVRPGERAALAAALAMVEVLEASNHLARPLDDADWEEYRAGRPIPSLPEQVRGNAGAWQLVHGILNGKTAAERAEILEGSREAAEAGIDFEAILLPVFNALTERLKGVPNATLAQFILAFSQAPEAAHALVCAVHGPEALDAQAAPGGP